MSTEQKEHLKDLLNLPSLEALEKRKEQLAKTGELFGHLQVAGHRYTVVDLERQFEQWRMRDAIQATRPEGCWCLGLGGRGRKLTRLGVVHAAEYCSCPEGVLLKQDETRALRAEEDILRAKRQAQQWRNAQIPLRFQGMRLETSPLAATYPDLLKRLHEPESPPDDSDLETTLWRLRTPEDPPPDPIEVAAWGEWTRLDKLWMGSWFFHGSYGVGKTGLAVGLAYARLDQGMMYIGNDWYGLGSLLFVTVPSLLAELRSTYGRHEEGKPSEQDVLRKYISVDLLILDDLGAEQVKDTGWVEDRLYQVIGTRHDELRSTIFTSNLSLEQLAQRIGERTVWRIAEMCGPSNIVEVKGPNLRSV